MANNANDVVLTADGKAKLEEELHYLETEKRDEVGERIRIAREFGDISENSEYDAAKEDQARNAARIAEIRATLANAQDAVAGSSMIVSIGSVVTLIDGEGEASDFTIVGTTETNVLEHKISNESPVGRAIIGHGEGESVEVVLANGKTRVYTIAKISR